MGNFNFHIPNSLHQKFRLIALVQERNMKDILLDHIRYFVEKNKDVAVIKEKVVKGLKDDVHIFDESKQGGGDNGPGSV